MSQHYLTERIWLHAFGTPHKSSLTAEAMPYLIDYWRKKKK